MLYKTYGVCNTDTDFGFNIFNGNRSEWIF